MIGELESLLEEIENLEGKELKSKLKEYVRKIIEAKELSTSNFSQATLFDSANSLQQKNFISACLIRLLCHNENAVWEEVGFRNKVFELFDQQLSNIYRNLKIEINEETHRKLSSLRDLEQGTIREFKSITSGISNLKVAIDSQSKIMKALKKPENRIFLENFTNNYADSENRLKELFDNLKLYSDLSEIPRMEAYSSLDYLFYRYDQGFEDESSAFAFFCLREPFQKIHNLIREDFDSSDIIKSATVKLSHPNRKYPFHKAGESIQLKFIIENEGLGHAFNVQIRIMDADCLAVVTDQLDFREIKLESLNINVLVTVCPDSAKKPSLLIEWSWQNYDKTSVIEEELFEFDPQREDINWDQIKHKRPYNLQAVNKEEELVGREDLVANIYTNLVAETIESAMIFGQKRVGKTSIAQTLAKKLLKEVNVVAIFIKLGDLDKTSAKNFIKTLGESIVDETIHHEQLRKLEIARPIFDDVLSPPIAKYFKRIKNLVPSLRFIIIIDEFDEIPSELYRYTEIGSTFLHNIRSLSQEGTQIGFVLIGGENMQSIRQSTDKLNLFSSFKVDYFSKEKFWTDFKNLIRCPVEGILEFSNESLDEIYESTEGNPFFTKFICDKLFKRACDTKDSYISIDETKEAIRDSIESLDLINVNHFWIDGILKNIAEEYDEIETQRRKFLIAYGEIKRCKGKVQREDFNHSSLLNDVAIDTMIENFINRGILLEDNGYFRLKPRLFDEWLVQRGSSLLTSTFSNANAIEELKSKEDKAFVSDQEIGVLVKSWSLYRGTSITPPQVRIWLDQFENNIDRRLMFKLLKKVKFYSDLKIREKLKVIHNYVKRNMSFVIKEGERSTREILLSSFGQPSKSGSSFARMYSTENNIISTNIASLKDIPAHLQKENRISALVFTDDIIASGGTIVDGLKSLNVMCGELLLSKKIKVVVCAVCGLESGKETIERELSELPFNVDIYICDVLNDAERCFTDESLIFENEVERNNAKEIAQKHGTKLQKKTPLGFNNGQLLIVFHDTCPNNSLPILWCSTEPSWIPLFPR